MGPHVGMEAISVTLGLHTRAYSIRDYWCIIIPYVLFVHDGWGWGLGVGVNTPIILVDR